MADNALPRADLMHFIFSFSGIAFNDANFYFCILCNPFSFKIRLQVFLSLS